MDSLTTHQTTVMSTGHVLWRKTVTHVIDGHVFNVHHRRSLEPGDPLDDAPDEVARVARAAWTDDVVKTFRSIKHGTLPQPASEVKS